MSTNAVALFAPIPYNYVMRLTTLNLTHYKTIEEPLFITHFSDLHILIGPNNSGKTNLLDAIEFLLSAAPDADRLYDPSANLSLTLAAPEGAEITFSHKNEKRAFLINGEETDESNLRLCEMHKRFIRIAPVVSLEQLIRRDLAEFHTNHPREYQLFHTVLREYFSDIELSEELFVANVFADRKERPVARMGEGFKRLFVMLFYIFHPDYHIILIDEPELHMHPTVVKRFLRALIEKQSGKQIFLTTHSSVFVRSQTLGRLWRVVRDEKRNTKVYSLPQALTALPKDRLVQELDADNSEMFFADKVLLVEGVSDRILMRGLIDRFYTGESDIKVVYTGSKGNMDVYVDICRAFHIPYAVMLDCDALHGAWSELLKNCLKGYHKVPREKQIEILRHQSVFILDCVLEDSYPKRYQTRDTKPLNALLAARMITEENFKSPQMRRIRDVVQSL